MAVVGLVTCLSLSPQSLTPSPSFTLTQLVIGIRSGIIILCSNWYFYDLCSFIITAMKY